MSCCYKFLVACYSLFAIVSQGILWEKSCGGKHEDDLFDAIPTPDYGFILAGCTIQTAWARIAKDKSQRFCL